MRRTSFTALIMALVISFCGCSVLPSATKLPIDDEETNRQTSEDQSIETDIIPGDETSEDIQVSGTTAFDQSSFVLMIPNSADMPIGWEFVDITVNGEFRRVNANFLMEPSAIDADPCYTYYDVTIHSDKPNPDDNISNIMWVGKYFFKDNITKYIREVHDPDELVSTGFYLFEYDFKAAAYKGKDKEYVVVSIPANWEKDMATLMIAKDDGSLIATLATNTAKITLSGNDADKYKDYYGYCKFFTFNENSITFLKISKVEDGVTYLTEYEVTVDNNKISTSETGNVYQTSDTVPEQQDFTIY